METSAASRTAGAVAGPMEMSREKDGLRLISVQKYPPGRPRCCHSAPKTALFSICYRETGSSACTQGACTAGRVGRCRDAQVFRPLAICHPVDEFVLYDVPRHGALPLGPEEA